MNERSEVQGDVLEALGSDERVMEMFAIVAHELRSPLAIVRSYASLLASSVEGSTGGDAEEHRRPPLPLEEIAQRLERSTELVSLMLDRLRDGWTADEGLTLQVEQADLVALVEETVTDLETALVSDHPIEVNASPDRIVMGIDVPRIRQILFNLLGNAAQYSEAGAPIIVSTSVRDEVVRVEVRNHGFGVAPEDTERIFERFARVGGKPGSGHGIGLWLSREIARAHGGDLRLEPAEEEGSVFSFVLPLERTQHATGSSG